MVKENYDLQCEDCRNIAELKIVTGIDPRKSAKPALSVFQLAVVGNADFTDKAGLHRFLCVRIFGGLKIPSGGYRIL